MIEFDRRRMRCCGADVLRHRVACAVSVLAIPNTRSSHTIPTPTLGGIAIAMPIFVWARYRLGADPLCLGVLGSGGILAVSGVVDDVHDLWARVRFPIQGIAVAFAVWMLSRSAVVRRFRSTDRLVAASFPDRVVVGESLQLHGWHRRPRGESVCLFLRGCTALGKSARHSRRTACGCLLGAAFGFLLFNRAPARIFMGDVGSGLLGLLVGILGLKLDWDQQMPLIASLILLAGFWFDASYTLCVRIATGQSFVSAHRSHLYQKLRAAIRSWTDHIDVRRHSPSSG